MDLTKTIITISISVVSLFISILSYIMNKKRTGYLEVDKQYYNLLNISINNPKLRNIKYTANYYEYKEKDEEFYHKYCTYAFMVWNFIETIYDVSKTKKAFSYIDNVWLPIILEENKLHYAWFTRNKRLFRGEFVEFIKNKINQVQIDTGSLEQFNEIYKHYKKDFPEEERKNYDKIVEMLKTNNYQLEIIKLPLTKRVVETDNLYIGYLLIRKDDLRQLIFIDYFAILSDYRDCGYGSKALSFFKKKYPQYGIIFEIEKSDGDINSFAEKRRIFYERNGAIKIDVDYALPIPDATVKSLKMDLMIIKGNTYSYNRENVSDFLRDTISFIHSDFPYTQEVINSYIYDLPEQLQENEDIDIVQCDENVFEKFYDAFVESFASSEIKDKKHIKKLIKDKKYLFLLIRKKITHENIGFALVYKTKNNAIFLDYLTIFKIYENKGYGLKFFDYIKKTFAKDSKAILFDLSKKAMESKNIVAFIKKLNAKKIDINYLYPTVNGSEEYNLLIISDERLIEKKWIKDAISEAIIDIHSDYKHTKEVLSNYINKIEDFTNN